MGGSGQIDSQKNTLPRWAESFSYGLKLVQEVEEEIREALNTNTLNLTDRMKKEKKIINYNKKIRKYLLKKNKLNHLEKYVDTNVPVIIRNNINKKYSDVKILVLQYLTTKI